MPLKILVFIIVLLTGEISAWGMSNMIGNTEKAFRFEDYSVDEAKRIIRSAYPPGSDVKALKKMLEHAGAKCELGTSKEGTAFMTCTYLEKGIFSYDWGVGVKLTSEKEIESIDIGRYIQVP